MMRTVCWPLYQIHRYSYLAAALARWSVLTSSHDIPSKSPSLSHTSRRHSSSCRTRKGIAMQLQEGAEDAFRREGIAAGFKKFVELAAVDYNDREPEVALPPPDLPEVCQS